MNDKVIQTSEVKLMAAASLEKEIEDDLKVEDPKGEVIKATLKGEDNGKN